MPASPRFAVLDLETTGLAFSRNDRIVEVGVVLLDAGLAVEDRWQTLVNPQRDVGATHVHGIRPRDLVDAPEFADIADDLEDLLEGRVVVAHNARFDTGFLRAEFNRVGAGDQDLTPHSLCTMQLAPRVFPAATRKLSACCAAAGISLHDAHSALGDATATAALLAVMATHPAVAVEAGLRLPYLHTGPRLHRPARPLRSRTSAPGPEARPGTWMSRIAATMPRLPVGPAEECYLAVLDRALEDKLLSGEESEELIAVAQALSLDRPTVSELHGRYLTEMAVLAWADGIVTADERADLYRVASQLGFSEAAAERLASVPGQGVVSPEQDRFAAGEGAAPDDGGDELPAGFALRPGDRVTFTGETQVVPRDEWEVRARAKGLEVAGIAKKTVVVMAADPYSLSGKARKAREYGIPVVGEAVFARLLGEMG